ncbi:TonB-dependent receptor [Pedobacter sp. BS3]|uniref:TonB-dependent receptor n=1 Tax=Pedobacter sp. BS3 TaxID=2567937 RepID=UPI0011F03429|nr:TonB-dependent receptor [Pedobacter sp. BS3]TZF81445.1 TonB-dependent receptor [Pedobacter sp. BS3]
MKKVVYLFVLLFTRCFSINAQQVVVKGLVLNDKSLPISGAALYILNTTINIITDSLGNFNIKDIVKGSYIFQVSAVGYTTVYRSVKVQDKNEPLTIVLKDANVALSEVLVTAQKRDEEMQRLPVSITTLTSEQINNYKLWDIKDITAIVPNLYSSSSGDYRNVTSIRGIATTSYDQAVATYIDGVNQFGLDTYIAQLQDVERIEVLRGPQGTLYGRNAMGGVINIITKQPGDRTEGYVGLDLGNYGLQRYSFSFRSPLIKNKLFWGVAGLYDKQGGFYTNQYNNSRFDRQSSYSGNYYLKLLAGPQWSYTLNIKHVINRNHGAFPLVSGMITALNSPFQLNQNALTLLKDNVFNSSLTVRYVGAGVIFNSQTAYQYNYRYYTKPIDGDFSSIDGITIVNNYGRKWNKAQVLTQEVSFTSPASSSVKWTLGAYSFYQYSPVKQGTHFGDDAALVGAPYPGYTSINTNKSNSFGLAFFGDLTYSIIPKLDCSLGLRYDNEYKTQYVRGEARMEGEETMLTQADTSSGVSFNALLPKASVIYHINHNHHIYAAYNRGFRAGGISQLTSDPAQLPLHTYKPEHSNNFEIGSKHVFLNNRLKLNTAFFFTSVVDAQLPVLVLPDAVVITQNVGKLNSKGVEVELSSTPFKNVELLYNFGYTHARYKNSAIPMGSSISTRKGKRQLFTPIITSVLALKDTYGLSDKMKLIIHGEWKYLGKQFFDMANTIAQKGYGLINVRTGITISKTEVFFWGSNILNKKYADYAYDFGAVHLGNPRTYGISVKLFFNY